MLSTLHHRFQFSAVGKVRSKARKLFDDKVSEKVKSQAQKTSIPVRYHDKYFREDSYAQIRYDSAW